MRESSLADHSSTFPSRQYKSRFSFSYLKEVTGCAQATETLAADQWLIDEMKRVVPIWKKPIVA